MSDDEPAPAPAPASAPAATTATATSLPAPPTPEKEDGAVHAPAAPPPPATTSTSTAEGEGEDTAVMEAMELHLLTIKECFVYAVPRLATATGYRADDWGLANPLVTGSSLRCYRKGDDRLFLRIYASPPPASSDSNAGGSGKGGGLGDRPPTPRLFAEAPIYLGKGPRGEPPAPLEASFMPVTDSSRYFVLKVVDPSISSSSGGAGGAGGKQSQPPQRARHAFLGVGFREREDAFALKACVQDFVAYHERMARAAQLQAEDVKAWEEQEAADAEATTDATDTDGATDAASPLAVAEAARSRLAALGLKDGEKLRLNLGHAMEGRGHRHTPTLSASSPGVKAGSGGDGGLLLPPPPGDRSAAPVVAGFGEKERGGGWGEGEEEWGDFVS